MQRNSFTRPVEDLSEKTREYVDLRIDDVKLCAAKGLSLSLSKLATILVLVGVATSVILALSFGLILLIGELVGSYAWAAIGVAAVLGVGLWILLRKRDRLFRDTFVPLFVKLFFANDDEDAQ